MTKITWQPVISLPSLETGLKIVRVLDAKGERICECGAETPETKANAQLIAAAPEMIETLKGAHFFFTGLYDRLVNAGEEEEVLEEISKTLAAMNEAISKAS